MAFRLYVLLRLRRAWSQAALPLLACTALVAPWPGSPAHAAGAAGAGMAPSSAASASLRVADAPLMQGAGATITTTDVWLELQRLPDEAQAQLLADPAQLRQLIDTAYLRRALAARAEQQGLAQKDPVLGHLLLISREGLLAEAELQRAVQAVSPDSDALEKLAHSAYKAESERFNTPARTRARHILIRGTGAPERAQADKLLAELRAGGDFEALARKHSADLRSAAQGGDLGFFPKGQMAAPFDAALEKLKNPGDLSGVVPGPSGFHIIRLEGRQPASSQPYTAVREQLRGEITAKLQKDARTLALERLRAQAEGDADRLDAFIAAQRQALPAPAGAAETANAADAAAATPAVQPAAAAPTTAPKAEP